MGLTLNWETILNQIHKLRNWGWILIPLKIHHTIWFKDLPFKIPLQQINLLYKIKTSLELLILRCNHLERIHKTIHNKLVLIARLSSKKSKRAVIIAKIASKRNKLLSEKFPPALPPNPVNLLTLFLTPAIRNNPVKFLPKRITPIPQKATENKRFLV